MEPQKHKRRIRFPQIVRPFETREKIILRDYLALERTTLANERTLFAYMRTSLYLIIGGIALLQVKEFGHMELLAYGALVLSVLLAIFGLIRFYMLKRKLRKFYEQIVPEEKKDIHSIEPAPPVPPRSVSDK